jgi:hypothetical protein
MHTLVHALSDESQKRPLVIDRCADDAHVAHAGVDRARLVRLVVVHVNARLRLLAFDEAAREDQDPILLFPHQGDLTGRCFFSCQPHQSSLSCEWEVEEKKGAEENEETRRQEGTGIENR